jgi:hypothetical protein
VPAKGFSYILETGNRKKSELLERNSPANIPTIHENCPACLRSCDTGLDIHIQLHNLKGIITIPIIDSQNADLEPRKNLCYIRIAIEKAGTIHIFIV